MVDWFVVLTPLLLIPIVFPFVCVGCVLTRQGGAAPLSFLYQQGLDDVDSIEVHVDVSGLTDDDDDEGVPPVQSIQVGDIETEGTDAQRRHHLGTVPAISKGTMVCTCTVTMLQGPAQEADSKTYEKVESEPVPEFRLSRKPMHSGFQIL
jgi:hypothetical protein